MYCSVVVTVQRHPIQPRVQILFKTFQTFSVFVLICLECQMGGVCTHCDYSIGSIVPCKLNQMQKKVFRIILNSI